MQTSTADKTTGHWRWILKEFGISEDHLTGLHGPCPKCGGNDRFRFDDKQGRGTWFCNVCGSGDGFDLLELVTGRGFKDLAGDINKVIEGAPTPEPFKAEESIEKRRRNLNAMWLNADTPGLVIEYLANRGLDVSVDISSDLRGHHSLSYIDKKSGLRDRFPAMLALVRNKDGVAISMLRTYLLPDGRRVKKLMPGVEKLTGGAIHLVEPRLDKGEVLLVAEGIESALAGREMYWKSYNKRGNEHVGVWATVTAGMMKDLVVPEFVKHLIICGDNDFTFTGQAAAYELAKKSQREGRTVRVGMPTKGGADMLDCLNHDGGDVGWQGVHLE